MKGIENLRNWYLSGLLRRIIHSIKKDELFGKLAKNSSYLLSANLISSVIGFVQSIILARYLGVAQYGLLALVFSYVAIVNQFFDFRIWELITKYGSEYRAKGEKGKCLAIIKLGYGIDICTSIAAVVVAIILSKFVAMVVFHKPEMAGIVSVYAFSLLVGNLSNSSSAVLKVFDRFSWVGVQEIGRSLLSIILIAMAILLKWRLSSIILTYLVTALVSGVLFLFLSYVIIRKSILDSWVQSSIRMLKGRLREIGKFLLYTNMSGFLNMFRDNFDSLILGYFRGSTEVGWYKVAKNFMVIFYRITDPIWISLYPQLSSLWAINKKKEIRKLVLKASKIMAFIALLIILLVTLFAPLLINITVGSNYLNSATILRIMVLAMIWVILIWASPLLQGSGRPDLVFWAILISTSVMVVTQLILIPRWGYIGAGLAVVSNVLAWMITIIFFLFKVKEFSFLRQPFSTWRKW